MRASHRKAVLIFCLACVAAVLLPSAAFAEPLARWLLVVDTSMSMGTRSKNTEIAVHDLLATGMNDQMAAGDTLGVWTFNNELHSGEVPLQTWTPQDARLIAERTTQYIASLRYQKSTDVDAMLKEMLNVVQASDLITVLIISDADDAIKGTPFDAKINDYYKQHYRSQKKFKMPFITVLRGEKGKLTTYTVNMAQFTVDVPAIKREAPKPPPVAPKVAPKPVTTLPPLIITGKKPEASATTSAPAVAPPAAPAATNVPVATPKTAPAAETATLVPAPVTTQAAPMALAETPKPATPVAPTVQTAPAAEKPAVVTPSAESHTETTVTKAAPAMPELPSANVAKPVAAAPPAVAAQPKSVSNTPPVQTAVAVAPRSFLSQRNLWVAGVLLVTIGFVSVLLLVRRSRAPHTSLITSSFDREKK